MSDLNLQDVERSVIRSFPVRVIQRYLDAHGPNWATIIAWNLLFAFFPLILVSVTVLGLILQSDSARVNITDQLVHAFPGGQGGQIAEALASFKQRTGLLAVVSFVGLMWSGSALFGAMDEGLSTLYHGKPRDFLPQKLMAFAMILLFAALLLPVVLASSLLPLLQRLPGAPGLFSSGPAGLLIQIASGVLVATLLFALIYRVVPNLTVHLRDILPGAVAAGVLTEALTLVFPLFFSLSGGFASYGQTFALFFLLLTYAFLMAQIVVIGGCVNAVRQRSR